MVARGSGVGKSVSYHHPPRRDGSARATISLRDLALDDRERAFYGPRTGDWLLLGLMVVILLGNGAYIWHQTGLGSHIGRAAFFGLLLLCLLWAALVYTFKLSVCVRVGPQGVSVVRGPWRTELPWRDVARLTERTQMDQGQRYHWLVVLARDGRKMQIRDDMVDDYARFRVEVYERYRLWRDHGGTWGTTGGGPFTARETLAGQTFWAAVGAGALALPAIYFLVLLPETNPLGWILLLLAVACAAASGRGMLRRTTYTVDAKAIEARQKTSALKLAWRDVAKVERTRHAFGGVIQMAIGVGRVALKLAARTDGRVESFDWAPRVPEYLTLRGGGHQVRVRLHRLERPDELLAWVEFYERVGRRVAESEPVRKTGGPTRRLALDAAPVSPAAEVASGHAPDPAAPDLTGAAGPIDPWGAGRDGELERQSVSPAPTEQFASEDNWLRDEPPARRSATPPTGQSSRSMEHASSASAAPAFANHPPMDTREQALSGLDIFSSPPGREATPSAPGMPTESVPPPMPHTSATREPDAHFAAHTPSPFPTPSPSAPPSYAPEQYEPYERQAPRVAENWQPAEAARPWQPTPPIPSMQPMQPMRPMRPMRPASSPLPPHSGWSGNNEPEPEAAPDTPSDPIESLADSFAPWRENANWQPPQLPRFGPPAPHTPREE